MFIDWDKNPELTDSQLVEIIENLLLTIDDKPLTAKEAGIVLAEYGIY
jgi:hypothetical protein